MVVVGVAARPHRLVHRRARESGSRSTGASSTTGRATAVVVASGQYLRGADVVPRGHPGDGRVEVQVYAVARGERAGVRGRLPQGVHLPHPDITQTTRPPGRGAGGPGARSPLEVDGVRGAGRPPA